MLVDVINVAIVDSVVVIVPGADDLSPEILHQLVVRVLESDPTELMFNLVYWSPAFIVCHKDSFKFVRIYCIASPDKQVWSFNPDNIFEDIRSAILDSVTAAICNF